MRSEETGEHKHPFSQTWPQAETAPSWRKKGILGTQARSVAQQGKKRLNYKNVKENTSGLEQFYRTIAKMIIFLP